MRSTQRFGSSFRPNCPIGPAITSCTSRRRSPSVFAVCRSTSLPFCSQTPADVEHHLLVDAELPAFACRRLGIGPELLRVDAVVEDPQLVAGKLQKFCDSSRQYCEQGRSRSKRAEHALVERGTSGVSRPPRKCEEVVREDLLGRHRLAHPRALRLAVEVQHVVRVLLHLAHDSDTETPSASTADAYGISGSDRSRRSLRACRWCRRPSRR